MEKITLYVLTFLLGLSLGLVYHFANTGSSFSFGSVTQGNDYNATGTAPYGGGVVDRAIKVGSGSLGSIIVTKAGDAAFALYDATSTRALDAQGFASSTQHILTVPANLAAGTYTIDTDFHFGLIIDAISGTGSTSTITYR